jgi:hypothetical protein
MSDSYAGAAAREYLRLSGEALAMNANHRAIAFALQGILRIQMAVLDGAEDPERIRPPAVADGGRWTRPGRCPNVGGICNCTGACQRSIIE